MEDTKLHKVIDGKNIFYDLKLDIIFEEFVDICDNDRTNVTSPRDLCIELTNSCNFLCKNCFSQKKATFLSLNKTIEYIKYYESKVIRMCLTGGEPLLNPEFRNIVGYLNKISNMGKVINTNGFYLDDTLCNLLKKNGWTVAVSLHGKSETHNEYVGFDSYDRIIKSLTLLRKYSINTHIYTVIHNDFEENDILHLIELKKDFNISDLRLIKIRENGLYQNINNNNLTQIPENFAASIFYKTKKSNTIFISAEQEIRLSN